jgi:hypothetical protein
VRKLAREAVIFMLVGMLFVPAVLLTYRPYAEKRSIKRQQDYLRQKCDMQTSGESAYAVGECTGFRDAPTQKDLSSKTAGFDAAEYNRGVSRGIEVRNLAVRDENVVWAGLVGAPYGFVAGLIAWVLYRLVLFAVKG